MGGVKELDVSSESVNGSGFDLEAIDSRLLGRSGEAVDLDCEDGFGGGLELVRGSPGQGKSVAVRSLALEFCREVAPGTLPLVGIVDTGRAASGLISLVRESLPEERRDEARWFEPGMRKEDAINAFDTQLGCRYPLPSERAFLTNFLEALLVPSRGRMAAEGVMAMIPVMIDWAFRLRDDGWPGAEPRRYMRGLDEAVDAALDGQDAKLGDDALWWDAVDLLFEAGQSDAASLAQRHAVPTLGDVAAAVRAEGVREFGIGAAGAEAVELASSAMSWALADLSEKLPFLFGPTALGIGHVRVSAIGMDGLSGSLGSDGAGRMGALYMLAWNAVAGDWWIEEHELSGVPGGYRDWHMARLLQRTGVRKLLVLDHYEGPGRVPAVERQLLREARSARKARATIAVVSLEGGDSEDLSLLATGLWLFGTLDELREMVAGVVNGGERSRLLFEFAERTEKSDLRWSALRIAWRVGRRTEQVVSNDVGPTALWAFVGTSLETALRRRVVERLGVVPGLAALGRAFPNGSAMERMGKEFGERERTANGAAVELKDVVDAVAAEVVGEAAKAWPAEGARY